MAKQEKNKAGLQKGISSIFKGVSIPQIDGDQEPSGTSALERTDYTEPKPPVPDLQKSEVPKTYQATQTLPKAAPEHTDYPEPKQPTPEPQKTQAQKSYQVTPSLPKAATSPKSKAEPAHLPEFVTAQQSKVEPARQPKAEPAQKPKVEPAQQLKVVPAQRPKAESAQEPKVEPAQQPKVVPTRQPKTDIDKDISKKRPIVTISNQSFWQQVRDKLFQPKPGVSSAKQKVMVLMMPLLFITLIFMLFRGGVFGTSAGHTEASTEDTAPGAVTAGANNKIDWEIPAPYPTTLRDPMRLVPVEVPQNDQTETGKTIELIVKSILYSEDNPSAVISGRIVHEGEKIRDVNIIKISKDSVEFEMNGKRWTQEVQ